MQGTEKEAGYKHMVCLRCKLAAWWAVGGRMLNAHTCRMLSQEVVVARLPDATRSPSKEPIGGVPDMEIRWTQFHVFCTYRFCASLGFVVLGVDIWGHLGTQAARRRPWGGSLDGHTACSSEAQECPVVFDVFLCVILFS